MRKVNHPQVASGIFWGLKEGHSIIMPAQISFKGPHISTFPLLTTRHRIHLFMTTFSAAESLVCKKKVLTNTMHSTGHLCTLPSLEVICELKPFRSSSCWTHLVRFLAKRQGHFPKRRCPSPGEALKASFC
jgi:hypothetical protein